MAATVSAWGKPGAWASDAEEDESKEDSSSPHGESAGGETADFPSLAAAASGKTKKKKPQALSLQEFSAYSGGKPKGLTHQELSTLPTGPRERSAEELDRNKLGGGFRSFGGGGGRGEQPRRQGSLDRESSHEPSRADETDHWGANKKSSANPGLERGERGERGGSFGNDTHSRADDVDNWASNKKFVPSEPRRGGLGSESSDWARRKGEEGRRSGGAFDSLRERNGAESESWGRKGEESSGGNNRPRLNLQPRTLLANTEDGKPKGRSPFGEARPREEVIKEKGQDCQEIEEKLEGVDVGDTASSDSNKVDCSGNAQVQDE